MRNKTILATLAVLAFPLLVMAQADGYYDRSYARLSYVKGDVYVQRAQDLGYEQGEVNLAVVEGDKLGTRAGRTELQLGRRNYFRLDAETRVDLIGLPRRDYDPTKIHVLAGSVFVRVGTLDREKNIEIHSPDASFYILEEGLFRIDIRESGETVFAALSGSAEAAGETGSVVIRGGETVVATDGRFTSDPMGLQARRDDFAAWNETRDGLYARRTTRSYLPDEYADYETELSSYGRWEYESSYGNVWVPNSLYSDWRPYYYGRWVWYPIIGWTWVSSEPWGWATSHFGRWGWRHSWGWYWIPQRHWGWGPAWVHWYNHYDYVGWCPLSYYNRPAVIVNNIFYDRYDRNDIPGGSRALTVVNRGQLQNRRISQVALGQSSVERLGQITVRSLQPDVRPSLNLDNDLAGRARSVVGRENLRSVGRNFSAGTATSRMSADEIRSSGGVRNEAGQGAGSRTVSSRDSSNRVTAQPGEASPRRIRESGTAVDRGGEVSTGRLQGTTRSSAPESDVSRNRTIREFGTGTRNGGEAGSSTSTVRRNGETATTRALPPSSEGTGAGSTPRRVVTERGRSESTNSSSGAGWTTLPRYESRTVETRRSSEAAPRSVTRSDIPTYSPSGAGSSSRNLGSSTSRSSSVNPRTSSSSVRSSSGTISRSSSYPSRISGSSSSRSSSALTRSSSSYSAPTTRSSSGSVSRSSSSSSRSYSAPSRSSSSYSAPTTRSSSGSVSRSSSSSSRSYSAPSRSSSSYSSPSRSTSGSVSRSSGSSSSRSSSSSSRASSGSVSRSSGSSRSSSGSVSRSSGSSSGGSRSSGSVRRK